MLRIPETFDKKSMCSVDSWGGYFLFIKNQIQNQDSVDMAPHHPIPITYLVIRENSSNDEKEMCL